MRESILKKIMSLGTELQAVGETDLAVESLLHGGESELTDYWIGYGRKPKHERKFIQLLRLVLGAAHARQVLHVMRSKWFLDRIAEPDFYDDDAIEVERTARALLKLAAEMRAGLKADGRDGLRGPHPLAPK